MKQFLIASAAALALLAPGAASAATNLLVNGSFEQTTGQFEGWGGWTFYAGGQNALPGWTVDFGSVDVTNNQSGWSPASDGANSLDINGWDRGQISQSFDTVVGRLYTVTFDYSRNAAGAPDPATALVSAGAGSFAVSAAYDTSLYGVPGAMLWRNGGFSFVGTGHDTLTVTALVEGNGGAYFDNFNVSAAVPEPATWALMIGGFGLAGVALRRKQALSFA